MPDTTLVTFPAERQIGSEYDLAVMKNAAIANAIRGASRLRMPDLPITPPKLRAAIDAAGLPPLLAAAD